MWKDPNWFQLRYPKNVYWVSNEFMHWRPSFFLHLFIHIFHVFFITSPASLLNQSILSTYKKAHKHTHAKWDSFYTIRSFSLVCTWQAYCPSYLLNSSTHTHSKRTQKHGTPLLLPYYLHHITWYFLFFCPLPHDWVHILMYSYMTHLSFRLLFSGNW